MLRWAPRLHFCASHTTKLAGIRQPFFTSSALTTPDRRRILLSTDRPLRTFPSPARATHHLGQRQRQSSSTMSGRAWEFFSTELSSPRVVMGSMERGSDLPYRIIAKRCGGVSVAMTPRLYADHLFEESSYRAANLITNSDDATLLAFVCSKDVDTFVGACKHLQGFSAGVVLDLGWNAQRAQNGGYGKALLSNPQLLCDMVSASTEQGTHVLVSVSCASVEEVVAVVPVVRKLISAGCVGVVVDSRVDRGKETGEFDWCSSIAQWDVPKKIKESVGGDVPVFAYGTLNTPGEAVLFQDYTNVDSILADAELMHLPTFFSEYVTEGAQDSTTISSAPAAPSYFELGRMYLELMFENPLILPLHARFHLLLLGHVLLPHFPPQADDLKHANTIAALRSFLDDLENRVTKSPDFKERVAEVTACMSLPWYAPIASKDDVDPALPVRRFPGDTDQVAYALDWQTAMAEKGLVSDDIQAYAKGVTQLLYQVNKSVERRFNRIAKKKALRQHNELLRKKKKSQQGEPALREATRNGHSGNDALVREGKTGDASVGDNDGSVHGKGSAQDDVARNEEASIAADGSPEKKRAKAAVLASKGNAPLSRDDAHGATRSDERDEDDDDDDDDVEETGSKVAKEKPPGWESKTKQQLKRERRQRAKAVMADPNSIKVAVDMGLGDEMSRKETLKLADQIRRLYGANLRAMRPFHLHLTSLKEDSLVHRQCARRNAGFRDYNLTKTPLSHIDFFQKEQVVFLTPDSPNVLIDLLPGHVYVMGGLVDEQIKKNLTLDRADKAGIRTARLPIKEFSNAVQSKYAPVLSINQVLDGMLTLQHGGTWVTALEKAVPSRKEFFLHDAQTVSAMIAEMRENNRIVDGLYTPSTPPPSPGSNSEG